jgi:light-regulated signal transduction histidine kinase (bacteriophytochrome)
MNSPSPLEGGPLTLDNCAQEPIHIPGSIQPHGALIAFDAQGRLSHASANVATLLGWQPAFGQTLRPTDLEAHEGVHALIAEALSDTHRDDAFPLSVEARLNGQTFDVVAHTHLGLVICEFELREGNDDEIATFAQKAYRSLDVLKRQRSELRLLEGAVQAIREMTGFDRVMAYRFRHDDSGDVVAESVRADLDPYVGRRYPASDIPAQARRLYTINTLRLIADLSYTPVPLLADAAHPEPLDLSHSVLRSVSPIHVEYLRNMGVGASMSVSIVVAGKLWGMIACHHMSPRRVPYSIRMAADVMAQLLASSVQSMAAQAREAQVAQAAWLRSEISSRVAQGEDPLEVLQAHAAPLVKALGAEALVVSLGGKVRTHGLADEAEQAWAAMLPAWLSTQPQAVLHLSHCDQVPHDEDGEPPPYCGVLALRFDASQQGWIVALRREQIETIRWGGKPDKEIAHGPLGPRLTPRGSFDEWRETVRGTAVPWNDTQLEIASQLLDALSRVHSDRAMELDRLRSQLWAVLGHDLRNPLQSLSIAANVLDQGEQRGRMSTVIKNSAGRMQRLLRDVLDISRLQNGLGLVMHLEQIDLVKLVQQLIEETSVGYPDMQLTHDLPETLHVQADPGRLSQLVSNLLSNARHHGRGLVHVLLRQEGDEAVLQVSNPAPPIPVEDVGNLFNPFKRQSLANPRNRTGMGLGLYIASQIAQSHQGSIAYGHADGLVIFSIRLPLRPIPDMPSPASGPD